ncbi:MAG: tyrosine-type recombinase/integrase [Deltaproteobacteria bacterium]|nr:tyrosine-type recombinase/integrase [Candidatus Desulfobacula maris]
MRITKTVVDKLSAPPCKPGGKANQVIFRDSTITGFGLRITSAGAKSFIVEKRINGKSRRKTLGAYGPLTVEMARKEAMKFLGSVATGKDPIKEEKANRVRAFTLKETFEDYLLSRKDLKPYTIKDYTRSIDVSLSDWQNKPIAEITKDMVENRHRELGFRSHARANNTMRLLRALFNHAMVKFEDENGQPIITINPVSRLSETRAWYKVERRQTLIKASQLKDWYQGTMQLNQETTRDYLHLLLFTGLRRSEASRLAWSDIDFNERTLTIPETKNNQVHTLPLSDFLFDLLKRRAFNKSSPYVFPSDSERGYLIEPKTALKRVTELSGVGFTLHDLRRTFITIAESLDIPGYALKQLLNHKDPNDVTAGYIVFDINRLRKPMEKISTFILSAFETEAAQGDIAID